MTHLCYNRFMSATPTTPVTPARSYIPTPRVVAFFSYGVMLCLTVGLFLFYLSRQPDLLQDATRRDFTSVYTGGRIVLAGQSTHLYDRSLQQQIASAATAPYPPFTPLNVYPPWNSVLIAALAWLPYGSAYWLWLLLNVGVAAGAIRGLLALALPAQAERPILLLAAVGFAPLFHSLWQGQMSGIALLGLVGSVVMFQRGADRAAGLWLLLVLLKIQLLPLAAVALLIWRKPRAIIAFAVGTGLLLTLSLLVFGNWISALSPLIQASLNVEVNNGYTGGMSNWRGLLYVAVGSNTSAVSQTLEAALTGISLGGVVLLCWPYKSWGQANHQIRFALAAILLLLVSPHLYIHDAVVLLLPGFLLWHASTRSLTAQPSARLHQLRWLLGLGPLVFYAMQIWHPPIFQIGAWYLALLLALAFATRSLYTVPPEQLAISV